MSTEHTETIPVEHRSIVEQTNPLTGEAMLFELVITGEAEVTRGPLGRFIDLADEIDASPDCADTPPEIRAVLEELAARKEPPA
jgi:hypothetical protein